jgi:hypothetical protein
MQATTKNATPRFAAGAPEIPDGVAARRPVDVETDREHDQHH